MSGGYGQKHEIGIGFQNSFGTAVSDASSFEYVQFLEEDIGHAIEQLVDESMKLLHDEGDAYTGMRKSDGSLKMNIKALPIGLFLSSMFTRVTTETPAASGIYQHTFTPRTTDFDTLSAMNPLTILKFMDTNSLNASFYDMNPSNFELSIAQGELLSAQFGLMGGGYADSGLSGSQSPSFSAGKLLTWDQASVQIGGAANVDIQDMTITVDEALEASHTLNNSKFPSRVKRSGFRAASVAGTLKFRDEALYVDFINQTEQGMDVAFTGNVSIAPSSDYFEFIRLEMPSFRIEELRPSASIGVSAPSFTGKAKYNANSGHAIKITLQNTRATYPA